MFSQPSPNNRRFPPSFFSKKRPKMGDPKLLNLEHLENRNTPTVGLPQALNPFQDPFPESANETFLYSELSSTESMELVGEVADKLDWAEAEPNLEQLKASFAEDEIPLEAPAQVESPKLEISLTEVNQAPLNQIEANRIEANQVAVIQQPRPQKAPSPMEAVNLVVDMKAQGPVDPIASSRDLSSSIRPMEIRKLGVELGQHGRATADHRTFATGESDFSPLSIQSSHFLIRPGIVTPITMIAPVKASPSVSPLVAWGAVLATGAAHLAASGPTKRRLSLESRPAY